jgi:hypothetical protein
VAAGAKDTLDRRLAHLMAQADQLAVYPAISPRGILPRQPQHQKTDLLPDRRGGLAGSGKSTCG